MDEPIAIVGLDARFPGEGDTAERFYQLLLRGESARTEIPPERYNADAYWHPDPERCGATRTRAAHFLKGSVTAFDAPFFSITPAEAASMDPQQRGMLECVYHALENAGIPLKDAAGTPTGVYVGCMYSDYARMAEKDLDAPSKYAALGTVYSMLSNRVSWCFDFRGPSITVDTACSSSLVAINQACNSLKLRETSMAIVGGCNLILSPEFALLLDAAGVLGPDGKSYAFDQRGNGYARGEGFGVVVLKRVSDAIRDGDMIRAVIRNTGSNSDGRSPGITQPTKAAQAALIKQVYSRAALDPSITRFFEAHGTGTAVGDPIEASAISEIFTPYRSADQPLYIGALKSNIGHLEGAAGVAAVIKGVFTLEQGIIPANTWFERKNTKIEDSWFLEFPTKPLAWPQTGLRRMSINSFGVGGTNAHVVMDDALNFLEQYHRMGFHRTVGHPKLPLCLRLPPESNGRDDSQPFLELTDGLKNGLTSGNGHGEGSSSSHHSSSSRGSLSSSSSGQETPLTSASEPDTHVEEPQVFVFSSSDKSGVARVQESYLGYLKSESAAHLVETDELRLFTDLSYTLAAKRSHHAWRSFIIAKSTAELQATLATKPVLERVVSEPRLAFIFTGQGAQWPAMGRELMIYPAFQQSLYAADYYLNSLGCTWSLIYELCKDPSTSQIGDPEYCQPICTALQIALVDLLKTWNIHPDAAAGHSSGEVAAAYAAGQLTREDAWRIAYYRGKLSAKLVRSESQPKTGMAAVALDKGKTLETIERVDSMIPEGALEIACLNSPESYTISGDVAKIEALVDVLKQDHIFARKLNVDIGYHSRYMKPIADEYLEMIGSIRQPACKKSGDMQYFSALKGAQIPPEKLQSPSYWVDNLTNPVRFSEAVTEMLSTNTDGLITDILEIGPHSALKGPLRTIAARVPNGDKVKYNSLLLRHSSAIDTALSAAGSLFTRGHPVDLSHVNNYKSLKSCEPVMLIDLPGYPFDHAHEYLSESRLSKNHRLRPFPRHELLGAPSDDWNKYNAVWRNYIRLSENPWIEDHKVAGEILYPAAGMLVMAIEASRQIADKERSVRGFRFKDVSFHAALRIPDDACGVETQFCLRPVRENSTTTGSTPSWNEFQLFSFEDGEAREHCRGLVRLEYETDGAFDAEQERDTIRKECDEVIDGARNSCVNKVATDKLYHGFRQTGLDFGPTFRTLNNVRLGPDLKLLATGNSTVSLIREQLPAHYVQPHLVHPSMLDSVVQANLAPLVVGLKRSHDPIVPIYADELWVSAKLSHESYLVATQPKSLGRQETESSFTAVDPTTGEPMVFATSMIFKNLPSDASKTQDVVKRCSYSIKWKPDPTLLNQDEAIQAYGIPVTQKDDPSVWLDDCEALCLLYTRQYIDSISEEDIEKMEWYHQKYVSWMKHISETSTRHLSSADIKQLEQRVDAAGTPEGKLIMAVGQNLSGMLQGPVDPLDIIFGNKLAENVYRYGLGSKRCYAQLCNYIDALAHKNPNMEILEIGAGTGGATRPVMETLTQHGQRYEHYDFTDISPSFFEHAKESFKDHLDHMSFKLLNVEKGPEDQGFAVGRYDLVLAANVLHATKSIDLTLSNVRTLLKPGGKLVVFELTNPAMLLGGFCFGVLSGWWLSEDADRPWGPLMSADSWRKHLTGSGFAGLDVVFDDFPDPAHQSSSILVSTVPIEESKMDAVDALFIFAQETSVLQQQVAKDLTALVQQDGIRILGSTGAEEAGLTKSTCVLLQELDSPVLGHVSEQEFASLKRIIAQCARLIWLTRGEGPEMNLVTGLARTIRTEKPGFKFITLSFEQSASPRSIAEKSKLILEATHEIADNSFRMIDGRINISRLVDASGLTDHIRAQTGFAEPASQKLDEVSDRAMALRLETPGALETMRFEDDPIHDAPLGASEVEFKVNAYGLSHRDLEVALGKVIDEPIGIEAAGIVTRLGPECSKLKAGDSVVGLCFSGALRTHARADEEFLFTLPETVSLTDTASIPADHTTAYAVLQEMGSLIKGDTILIHSAADPSGQAALQFSQHQGAEVFATANSFEDCHFIETTYGIPSTHVFSTNETSFKTAILRATDGRGVDVIFGSLSNGVLAEACDCVVPFGRVVNLSSGSEHTQAHIPTKALKRGVRFESFDLRSLAVNNPARAKRSFQRAMDAVFNSPDAEWRKTLVSAHSLSRAHEAFSLMQSEKHTTKVVLEARGEDVVSVLPSRKPACRFSADASYIIAGGFGGLGRSIARWMVSRGAKNLILLSRSGPVRDSAKQLLEELEPKCSKIATPACDVTDAEALRQVIADSLTNMPPIKGCVQGSMVLKDNRFEDMNIDEWTEALRPKVDASWNLHTALGSELDFFILLSSTVGLMGSPEQSNYAAGSTFQDALARCLASQGLNAVALDLPVILDAGFVAEKPGLMDQLRSLGWSYMEQEELHATLDYYCHKQEQPISLMRSQAVPRFWLPQDTAAEGVELPAWRNDPLFCHLRHTEAGGSERKTEAKKDVKYATMLAVTSSPQEAEKIVLEALLVKLSRVLSVDVLNLDAAKPLHAYGVDSLVAVELRSWLSKELGADLSVFEMTNKPSIQSLAVAASEKSRLVPKTEEAK